MKNRYQMIERGFGYTIFGDDMKQFTKLFAVGGLSYTTIELLWRGRSHWSMFLLGGTCFHLIGKIGGKLRPHGVVPMAIACSGAVTAAEYVSGCILNRRLKLGVWDYSDKIGNIHGQVCPLYSALWGGLSIVAVPLYLKLSKDTHH